jgi:hypothetical protein
MGDVVEPDTNEGRRNMNRKMMFNLTTASTAATNTTWKNGTTRDQPAQVWQRRCTRIFERAFTRMGCKNNAKA